MKTRLSRSRLSRGVIAASASAALALGSLVVVAPAAHADTAPAVGVEETVSADPLPTAQIDGVVWTQAVARDTVWVGGEFTTARPAGAAAGVNTVPRANLMAYNLQTGVMTSWNPGANAAIKTIVASPDGSRIYVGGMFTTIAGQPRNRMAAFDTATGALLPWAPYSNAGVTAMAAHGNTVFVAGNFSSLAGGVRTRVGAVTASNAALLPLSATLSGGYGVTGLVVDPTGSKIVLSGSFESTNGSTNPGRGLAALDAATGASLPWAVNSLIRNGGTKAAMTALESDGDSVYGTGYDYGGGAEDDFEGTFRARWSDGSLVWLEDCHGDNYSVAVHAGVVYTASHDHYCGNIGGFPQTSPTWTFHHSMAFAKEYHGNVLTPDIYGYKSYTGQPAASGVHWYPDWQVGTYTGKSQATWDVEAAGDYVIYGGEFLKVNNKAQQGLVRFAVKSVAPNKEGPQLSGTGFAISAKSLRAGEVRLSWPANTDRDNQTLTYQIFRQDKGSTPIRTVQGDSNFWTTPRMTYADKTVTPGQTYQYRVRAIDPLGNQATGAWTTVTATAANTATDYSLNVLDDGAIHYWPLSETAGATAADWVSGGDLTLRSATQGVTGPNLATPTTATQFGGSSSSYASTSVDETGLNTLSVEAWFKTTSTRGGKVVSFGNKSTGGSGTHDRSIYLDNSGRVTFGVYPGTARTVSSGTGYNNGQWHHVVGTLAASGMTLYIDGVRIGTRADTISAQTYNGYWRVGGDTPGGWPNVGSSGYLNGAIADVAIYNTALTRAQIDAHLVSSGRNSALPPAPADAYGKAVYTLEPTLYWRLGEGTGTIAADAGLDAQTGTYFGNATKGAAGALSGVTNTAISLAPTKSVFGTWNQTGVTSDKLYTNPTTFSAETWFKTNTTTGGKILGFGSSRTGLSNNYDRHIYMTADGKLNFGVYNGSQVVIATPASYNDNAWHHVVAQLSSTGMQLYVDGSLVGSNPNAAVTAYNGYWRVGGDNGWAGDTYWKGSVDEVAVYPAPLTASQVLAHYQRGALGFVNEAPTPAFGSIVNDLDVAVDASASNDPDNAITSYQWAFGDGATASGLTASHTYAAPGVYEITLKVTDALGASATLMQEVNATGPNILPTAAFATSADNLALSVDGSTSSDPDGTIDTYSWAFGDGSTAGGVTASHTYSTPGTYTVSLTVTDDRGGSVMTSKQVTVSLPPNQNPTASFSSVVSGLKVSVSGAASSDPDGTIVSHEWEFGDGQTGTGSTATHTYAVAGTYTVRLTVTDDRGGTASKTSSVTVAVSNVIASDEFDRAMANGWGTADEGGAWTVAPTAARFAVAGGAGTITSTASTNLVASLGGVSSSNTVLSTSFSVDKIANAHYISFIGRQVGSEQYLLRARIATDGSVILHVMRGGTAIGAGYTVPGLTIVAGDTYKVAFEVKGTSPTALSGKIWKSTAGEPAAWQIVRSDSTAALQVAGSVGVASLVPTAANAYPLKVSFPALTVTDPTVAAPPANEAPVAAFTSSVSGLGVSVNGSTSADADGTIASYAWAFGDGGTGTGATASHTYAAAGTYTVTLTVTDDDGATDTESAQVMVAAVPPANEAPVAAFTSSVSGLGVSVNGSTSADADGTIASYAWAFGDGGTGTGATASHTYAAAGTYTVTLTVTDDDGATDTESAQVTVAAVPPANNVLARDLFERTSASGWGTADTGGAWAITGTAARFSVEAGAGVITLTTSTAQQAMLPSVSSTSTRIAASFTVDKIANAQYIAFVGRQVGAEQYLLRVRVATDGSVILHVMRGGTAIGSGYTVPGLTITPGESYRAVFDVTGTAPTTLAGKLWKSADAEPAAWQITRTDATATMQAPGAAGVWSVVPTSANAYPLRLSFGEIAVTDPQIP